MNINNDICAWYTLIGNGCESCPYYIDDCKGIRCEDITLSVDEQGYIQIGRKQTNNQKVL